LFQFCSQKERRKVKMGEKQCVLDLSSIRMHVNDNEISGLRTFHSFCSTREYAKGFYRSPSSRLSELSRPTSRLWCSMNSNSVLQISASWRYCTMNNYRPRMRQLIRQNEPIHDDSDNNKTECRCHKTLNSIYV